MADETYRVKDIRRMFDVRTNTVYRWIKDGLIVPLPRSGERDPYIFTHDEVRRFANEVRDVEDIFVTKQIQGQIVKEVVDSMTPIQQEVLYYLVGLASNPKIDLPF